MGTIYLIQKVGRDMRARGKGRILITGSIAGFLPGTYQAVYNATKLRAIAWSCYAEQHDRLRPRLPRPSTAILLRVSAMRTFGLRTAIFLPALGIPPLVFGNDRRGC